MRIVLLGAGGQLASDLAPSLSGREMVPFQHRDLDVCEHEAVRKELARVRPDTVINTAAFVHVDDCEEQVETAFRVNSLAVLNLARICQSLECALVQVSTDYVFGGGQRTPYAEDDPPKPLNVYGVSKLAGELFARRYCAKHFVVRSSGLYGPAASSKSGGNFVQIMLNLAEQGKPIRVVDDQVLAPTYTADLAQRMVELLETEAYGLYHLTNSGQCSWYRFAAEIFEQSGLQPELYPISSIEYGAKARRPAYSVLRQSRSPSGERWDMRSWEEALTSYLEARSGS